MRTARAAHPQAFSGTTAWTSLGPAPLASDASGTGQQDYGWVSGRATAVAIDPADSSGNTVYLGGAYGGLWKSTNAGSLSPSPADVVWTPVIDDQATLAVGAIAIQPGNADPTKSILLVGTGETNSSSDSYYGLGILRSADAGKTWTLISQDKAGTHPFAGLGFSKIAFNQGAPNIAVAAAAGASMGTREDLEDPVNVNRGLYYSTDSGLSWTFASVKDAGTIVAPASATTAVYNAGAAKFFAALRFHGFYSSSDGANWTRLAKQPGDALTSALCPTDQSSSTCPLYRAEIAVVPGRNEMYAWFVDSDSNDQGMWKSVDGGTNWVPLNESGITNCGDLLGGCGTFQGSYNLELAAVATGSATDLYAGAVNLYKCTVISTSACDGTGVNTFINLTHVYGCPPDFGSIAHVHPNQHALDAIVAGGKAVMYFANDGGIYRTLDGFTGLTFGACGGGTNQFDSLNQTLGSMTQLVSFSQHPIDSNTLLGGAQGNGSPATASSRTSTTWLNVNSGDGGYNAINPSNPSEWFTANTGVSIQRCTLRAACHSTDFNNQLVVSNATVGGDMGPLYTPYLLDPQNSAEFLVGTCRLWRGTTSGNNFKALSNNFETGGPDSCDGEETNLVRAIAAGGPQDNNHFSKVIYAGTDGLGPLLPTLPTGGHLWVTTNASGGTSTWADRTGPINPENFPIAAIALDASDATGNTAYVGIMGFHTSHVWKTASAGASWVDFTGGFPDAPVNALLVDSGSDTNSGTLYVGTDVGVFSTSTASPAWTEVGPGLPNVAVTALRMFDTVTTKLLRASTYGRGIWQFPLVTTPDFELTLNSPTQTVFAGQTIEFDGLAIAFNGYRSSVSLLCAAGSSPPPPNCVVSPSNITPTDPGASFTLTAGGPVGDYVFNVEGDGSDTSHTVRTTPATLHVVDFTLSPLSPPNITVNRGQTSGPVSTQLSFLGAFPTSGVVSLACGGLPTGASCSFLPGVNLTPSLGNPIAITLTVTTSSATPTGKFNLSITATSTAAGSKTVIQPLVVNVNASGDFVLALSTPPTSLAAGDHAVVPGTLTALNGYNSAINLSCVAGTSAPPATCTFTPAKLTPTANGAAFNLTLGSPTAGSFAFNAQAVGTDASNTSHSLPVALAVYDFQITPDIIDPTVPAGQTATYSLNFALTGVATFPQDVTYTCTGLPRLSTCSFSPAQISAGSGTTSVSLLVATTAPIASDRSRRPLLFYAGLFPIVTIFACAGASRRKRLFTAPLLLLLAILLTSCGGGFGTDNASAQPGTPPGTYTVVVNASSGTLRHSVQMTRPCSSAFGPDSMADAM